MKKMKRTLAIIAIAAWGIAASAQTQEPTENTPTIVTVNSNGLDVRSVLHQVFTQAKKNYIVDNGVFTRLYINLSEVTFETAIETICKNAALDYEIEGDLYRFFRPKQATAQVVQSASLPTVNKVLDQSVLNKKINTRLDQVDIRKAIAEISKQAGVPIEVAPEVKALKVNAYLIETSLRYALNSITQAAKLTYVFTNKGTILICDPSSDKTPAPAATKLHCGQCQGDLEKGWKYCPHCGNYVKNITS